MCDHGGHHQWGVNYWETRTLVANWESVRLSLDLSHVCGLESNSIDFVLAFPQAVLETEVYVETPQGFDRVCDSESHALKLVRSIHGLKKSN